MTTNGKEIREWFRLGLEILALTGLVIYVCETRRTNDLTQKALNNAKDQFRIDQRPYVWVDELGPFFRAPHTTGSISDRLAFPLKFKNYGKSPAIHCQIDARITIGEQAWKKIAWKTLDPDKGTILPPGKVDFNDAFSDEAISEEYLKRVLGPGIMEPVEVLGHIQYFGTDGTQYTSDFVAARSPQRTTIAPITMK